ncbi:MAG: hypothetical protein GY862_04085, partial [Gammaproteobacteria bacterium]|nr:hypothetical protein [Gammaproteobacteria bacterium]
MLIQGSGNNQTTDALHYAESQTKVQRVAFSGGNANETGEFPELLPRGARTICVPADEEEYAGIIENHAIFRTYLNGLLEKHPELFPRDMPQGYELHDFLPPSVKPHQNIGCGRSVYGASFFCDALHDSLYKGCGRRPFFTAFRHPLLGIDTRFWQKRHVLASH